MTEARSVEVPIHPNHGVVFEGDKCIYTRCDGTIQTFKRFCGTYYYNDTPEALMKVLDDFLVSHERIHLYYGETDPNHPNFGKDLMDTCDRIGYLGRSTGPLKMLLLLHNSRSTGGCGIYEDRIVRITTTKKPIRVLYQHPTYFQVGR